MRSTATVVFGVSCYNCIGASCYKCSNASTDDSVNELCADND